MLKKIKRIAKKILSRHKGLYKFLKKIYWKWFCRPYSAKTYKKNAEELKNKMISWYSVEDTEKVLTVYSLGTVEPRKHFGRLKELLAPADMRFAYISSYDKALSGKLMAAGITGICVAGDAAEDQFLVRENSWQVYSAKGINLGLLHITSDSEPENLSRLIEAAQQKADYLVAYLSYSTMTPRVQALLALARKHCGQIVGICTDGCLHEAPEGTEPETVYAAGSFLRTAYANEAEKDCVIVKTVAKRRKIKVRTLERSFIPCVFDEASGSVRIVNPANQEDRLSYRRLNTALNNLSDVYRVLNLEQIFEIVGLEIPEQYRYLKSVMVEKICSHAYELGPRSVYFVRDYDGVVHTDPEDVYYEKILHTIRKRASSGLLFVFSPVALPDDIPHMHVESALALHAKLCTHIISSCYIDLQIAVTGSTGKTSTKEMVANALSEQFRVYKSHGNENLQIRLVRTLNELNPKYEVYIQEVGGGKIGGASSFSKLMQPDIGVVTNIGYSHLRWSKTREQLAINKIGIGDGIRNNGPLFLNMDNDKLQEADISSRNVITYGIENPDVDYKAENVTEEDNRVLFDIVCKEGRTACVVNTPGLYNVYNALVAFGIGRYAGMAPEKIVAGIAKFKPEGIRQTLVNIGGYNLFIDCYNAAPNSMIGTVKTLSSMGGENFAHHKIAVLADMTGLEELSESLHTEVGKGISDAEIDYLICYGEDIRHTYEAFTNPNVTKILLSKREDVVGALSEIMKPGDYISFKGSSKFKLEEIIDQVFGTNFSTLAQERKEKRVIKKGGVTYQIFAGCMHADSAVPRETVKMLGMVEKKPVLSVTKGLCEDWDMLTEATLPSRAKNIQERVFRNCTGLKKIEFPAGLCIIEDYAFENCISLEEVAVNEKLMHIGKGVFKNCSSLKSIKLPDSVTYIGEDAFAGCDELTILCRRGSYAQKYAQLNRISVEYYD